jgi:hypothetical protein
MKHFQRFVILSILFISINFQLKAQSKKEVLFSFKTKQNDIISIFRLQNESGLEFLFKPIKGKPVHYPIPTKATSKQNWDKFTYGYYFRPGGVENDGLDLNNLYFKLYNQIYVVYEHYVAADNSFEIGFKILNQKEELIKDYRAKKSTVKGSLIDLRHLEEVLPTNTLIYEND